MYIWFQNEGFKQAFIRDYFLLHSPSIFKLHINLPVCFPFLATFCCRLCWRGIRDLLAQLMYPYLAELSLCENARLRDVLRFCFPFLWCHLLEFLILLSLQEIHPFLNWRGWVGLWGLLWWAPSAKRKDHHGVSSGWSSVWHCPNTGLSSTQYEQIPIILGVWPFWLTHFFFSVNNILAGLWLNCISSVEITLFLLADILLQHRALFQC